MAAGGTAHQYWLAAYWLAAMPSALINTGLLARRHQPAAGASLGVAHLNDYNNVWRRRRASSRGVAYLAWRIRLVAFNVTYERRLAVMAGRRLWQWPQLSIQCRQLYCQLINRQRMWPWRNPAIVASWRGIGAMAMA